MAGGFKLALSQGSLSFGYGRGSGRPKSGRWFDYDKGQSRGQSIGSNLASFRKE